MHSQEEDMGEDHMKKEEDKSHRGLETTVEDTRGRMCPVKTKWVQRETQIQ